MFWKVSNVLQTCVLWSLVQKQVPILLVHGSARSTFRGLLSELVMVLQMGSDRRGPSSFLLVFQLLEALTPVRPRGGADVTSEFCSQPGWSRPGSHVMRGTLVTAARKGESHI